MSNIRTYHDLMEEKKRLESALVFQKEAIRQDLVELREEFRPVLSMLSIVGKIGSVNKTNPLIAMAVGLAGDLFLTKAAFSGGGKIARVVVPFLASKVSAFLHRRRPLFQKLAGMLKRNKSNGHALG